MCVLLAACGPTPPTPKAGSGSAVAATLAAVTVAPRHVGKLGKARAEFPTTIKVKFKTAGPPPPVPPAEAKLERVKYRAPLGDNWAYVTPDPKDGKRHPAVIWAEGGFDPSIGAELFKHGPVDNDQSALQLRAAGIIVMYPSYRGAHDNPGTYELLFGEVEDYLAAADHVRKLAYVDPDRIYFAGHSTGGTLVLLAAELTDQFRAAFVLGAATGAESYGDRVAPFDPHNADTDREWRMRAPIRFVAEIRRPTVVIEGEKSPNVRALPLYAKAGTQAKVPLTTVSVPGLDHFSVLAPQLEVIARKIVADTGPGEFAW